MKTRHTIPLMGLALLCLAPSVGPTATVAKNSTPVAQPPALGTTLDILHSNSTANGSLAKAPADTFTLYGGPGSEKGKFSDANGAIPQQQGWVGEDLTDTASLWQISTFNAETLNGHGVGNHAVWCGQTAAQRPSWLSPPGYGNNWNQILLWESPPLTDPSAGQIVDLDFAFLHDTEPGYDFFLVEYDSAGTWVNVLTVDGTSIDGDGNPIPTSFLGEPSSRSIVFAGNDYGGENSNQIRIRLRVVSDGAVSNQDGIWPSMTGAVQVDDISVNWSEGTSFDDFESTTGFADTDWKPYKPPFVGYFAHAIPTFTDIDPCVDNPSPQLGFMDEGQIANPSCWDGVIPEGPCSTGGQTSPNWDYGVTGGWVVNYTGGLSGGAEFLEDEIWSPEIDWDLPGTVDDGPDVVGARVRFSMWNHLPIVNFIGATWKVRSTSDGVHWSGWESDFAGHFNNDAPRWSNIDWDVTRYLVDNPLKIQIALGVKDFKGLVFDPNYDATPSPTYDNVTVKKYRVGGPDITALSQDLAQDAFPRSGTIDASSSVARDALDVSFGRALDLGTGAYGDSVVVTAEAVIPGSSVSDLRMVWTLEKNTFFEDAIRTVPARTIDENMVTSPTTWSGEVLAQPVTEDLGSPVPDTYFFTLPRSDFFYPGDTIRYYFRAADDEGRVTTLPEDTSGFASGTGFDRRFVVHALPSIRDAGGTQPTKLAVVQTATAGDVSLVEHTFDELGMLHGTDYDLFWIHGESADHVAGNAAGLGAAGQHGATLAQIGGYDTILFTSEANAGLMLGSDAPSDDVALLSAWHGLPGARRAAFFGDNIAASLAVNSPAGAAFVQDVLRVGVYFPDVRIDIDGQTTSQLIPEGGFTATLYLDGGCPDINTFDDLRPLAGATRGHGYLDPSDGTVYADPAASVVYDRMDGADRKVDVTFAFGFGSLELPMQKTAGNTSARVLLLEDLFSFFGVGSGTGSPVPAPAARELAMRVSPNPFNPRTTIRFEGLPTEASGEVRIYSVRGTLVRTLHDGPFLTSRFVWEGADDDGQPVASGVYLVKAQVGPWDAVEKVALIR